MFCNNQSLISAHIDDLVKIPKVKNIKKISKLRTVFDKLENNKNRKDLNVETATYG